MFIAQALVILSTLLWPQADRRAFVPRTIWFVPFFRKGAKIQVIR
jgi:hypothetical protein